MSRVRIGIGLAVLLMCSAFPAYAYIITSQYSESQCSGSQIDSTQTVEDETGVSCTDYCATQSATCCSVQHWYDFEGTYTSSRCLAKSGSGMSSNTNTATRQYWAYILSYATPQPELTAGSVTPTSATEGSSVTLSATITNSGSASTNATFSNLFQRATSAAGADTTDIGTYGSAALGASANASATLSYTFPSSGTWYVRACADKNSAAGVGTITETDESNNCGSWTAISVTAVGPDLTVLDPISISGAVVPGESIQFSALAKNIGSVTTAAGFESRFQLDLGANGTYDVTFDVTTAAAVSVDSSDLVTSAAWEVLPGSHRVRLCADLPPYDYGVIDETDEDNNCGAPLDFTVSSGTTGVTDISANSVCTGTQLSTQMQDTYDTCIDFCMNATAECCTVEHHYFHNGNDLEPQWMDRYECSAHTGTSIASQPYEEDYGPAPWVGVEGDAWYRRTTWTAYFLSYDTGLTAALVANPTAIDRGESSLLTWSSTGASSCTGTGFDTGGAPSGSVSVEPVINTTYEITCTNGSSTVNDSASVTVYDVLGVSCVAIPSPGIINEIVTWDSTVTGGVGAYEYTWSGDDGLTGSSQTATYTYNTLGQKNATLTVTSGTESVSTMCDNTLCQNASCTCTGPTCGVEVVEGTNTDLSASTPSLYSGLNEVGNNVTFQGVITNLGNNTINASFGNKFQVDMNGDGGGSYDFELETPASAYSIPIGGTGSSVSTVWSNIPEGTHKIRFCADLPPDAVGSVAESNEGNNCSGILTFGVGPSPLDLSIVSSSELVRANTSVLITWEGLNADSCSVTGDGLSSTLISGSQNVTVSSSSTYTITCLRGTASQSETVTVRVAPRYEEI